MTQNFTLSAEELLEQADWIRGLARSLVGPDDAEDLAQDTLAASLPARRPSGASLRPWLAAVARNLARNRFRASGRRQSREREAARPERLGDTTRLVERAELLKRVVDLVLRLPELQREAVYLRYVEGLRPAEIATRLEVAPSTVRTRIHDGLSRLRRELDAEHGEDRGAWCALLAPVAAAPRGAVELVDRGASPLLSTNAPALTMKLAVLLAVGTTAAAVPFLLSSQPEPSTGPAELADPQVALSEAVQRTASLDAQSELGARRSLGSPSAEAPAAEEPSTDLTSLRLELVDMANGAPLSGMPIEILRRPKADSSEETTQLTALGYAGDFEAPEHVGFGITDANGRFESSSPLPAGSYVVELTAYTSGIQAAKPLLNGAPFDPKRNGEVFDETFEHGKSSDFERMEFPIGRAWSVAQLESGAAVEASWICGLIRDPGRYPLNAETQAVPEGGSPVWPHITEGEDDPVIPVVFDEEGLWCWEGVPFGDLDSVQPEPRARVDARLWLGLPAGEKFRGRVRVFEAGQSLVLDESLAGSAAEEWTELPLRWLQPGHYTLHLELAEFEPLVRDFNATVGRSELALELQPLPSDGLGSLDIVIESRTGPLPEPLYLEVSSTQHPDVAGYRLIRKETISVEGPFTTVRLEGLDRREYFLKLSGGLPHQAGYVYIPEHKRRVLADGREVPFEARGDLPRKDVHLRVLGAQGQPVASMVVLVSPAAGYRRHPMQSPQGEFRFEQLSLEPVLSAVILGENCRARVLELTPSMASTDAPIEVRLEAGVAALPNVGYDFQGLNWDQEYSIDDLVLLADDRPVEFTHLKGLLVLNFAAWPESLRAVSREHGDLGEAPENCSDTGCMMWNIRVP